MRGKVIYAGVLFLLHPRDLSQTVSIYFENFNANNESEKLNFYFSGFSGKIYFYEDHRK